MSQREGSLVINQKGETILEITIAMGLILIVISGIAISTVNGLRNSQFSKNQLQATKYAQEMLEGVRTIKDRDYTVCGPSLIQKWSDIWTYSCNNNNDCKYSLENSGSCPANGVSNPFWLSLSPSFKDAVNSGTTFSKQIKVEDAQANQKKVTATVKWTDASGTHQSELTTIMSDYR